VAAETLDNQAYQTYLHTPGLNPDSAEKRFDASERNSPRDLVRRQREHSGAADTATAARKREEEIKACATAKKVAPNGKAKSTRNALQVFTKNQGVLPITDKQRPCLHETSIEEMERAFEMARLSGNTQLASEIERCFFQKR